MRGLHRTGEVTRRTRAWLPWVAVLTVLGLAIGTIGMLGGFVNLNSPPLGEEVKPDAEGAAVIETRQWDIDVRSVAIEPATNYTAESLVVTARMKNKTDEAAYSPPADTLVVQVGKQFAALGTCRRTENGTFPPDVWAQATCTMTPRKSGRLPPKGSLERVLVAVCDQRHGYTLDGHGTMSAGPVKAHVWLPVRDRR